MIDLLSVKLAFYSSSC